MQWSNLGPGGRSCAGNLGTVKPTPEACIPEISGITIDPKALLVQALARALSERRPNLRPAGSRRPVAGSPQHAKREEWLNQHRCPVTVLRSVTASQFPARNAPSSCSCWQAPSRPGTARWGAPRLRDSRMAPVALYPLPTVLLPGTDADAGVWQNFLLPGCK